MRFFGAFGLLGLLQLGVDDILDDLDLGRQDLVLRSAGVQKALLLRLLLLGLKRLEDAVQLLDRQIPEVLGGDDALVGIPELVANRNLKHFVSFHFTCPP